MSVAIELTREHRRCFCIVSAYECYEWCREEHMAVVNSPPDYSAMKSSRKREDARRTYEYSLKAARGRIDDALQLLDKEIDWFEALSSEQKRRPCASEVFIVRGMTGWLNEQMSQGRGAAARAFGDAFEDALLALSRAVNSDEELKAAWDKVNTVCRRDYPTKHPDVRTHDYPDFLMRG